MKLDKETISQIAKTAGMKVVASGVITTPVAYIDIPLPDGYRTFRMEFRSVVIAPGDIVVPAFSFDHGATFVCDPLNKDSYQQTALLMDGGDGEMLKKKIMSIAYSLSPSQVIQRFLRAIRQHSSLSPDQQQKFQQEPQPISVFFKTISDPVGECGWSIHMLYRHHL